MTSAASVLGGGGKLLGEAVTVFGGPVNFTQGGQEFLRMGSLKPYTVNYANAVAAMPSIATYGLASGSNLIGVATPFSQIFYLAGKYVGIYSANYSPVYATSLALLAAAPTSCTGAVTTAYTAAYGGKAVSNGTYILLGSKNGADTPAYTTNGTSWTAIVGGGGGAGSLASNDQRNTVVFTGSGWMIFGRGIATTSNYLYINNVNPTGAWGVTGFSLAGSGETTQAAFGNTVTLFGTTDVASVTANKLFKVVSVGAAPVDITANLPGVEANDYISSVVFTGTHHLIFSSTGKMWRTADGGTTCVRNDFLPSSGTVQPLAPATFTGYIGPVFTTSDGAGLVRCVFGTNNNLIAESRDHGVTWAFCNHFNTLVGNISGKTINYVNGSFVVCYQGSSCILQNVGAMTAPDYVGIQRVYADSQFIRIK